ncbi:MAG: YciI family protein [Thermomicrobiales bacterium]|nr:YciI family protein [Thermomicrobiales bacterium]
MKYLCIAFQDQEKLDAYSDEEFAQIMERVEFYLDDLNTHGNLIDASRLQPASSGAVIQVRRGNMLVSDGPFIETREQIAGYYLIEANDLNDAIRLAAKSPSAQLGTVEVRPLKELGPR